MKKFETVLSNLLDNLSEYFSARKGLLPLLGTALIVLNLILEIFLPGIYISQINLFLHMGLIVALFGLVLASAL